MIAIIGVLWPVRRFVGVALLAVLAILAVRRPMAPVIATGFEARLERRFSDAMQRSMIEMEADEAAPRVAIRQRSVLSHQTVMPAPAATDGCARAAAAQERPSQSAHGRFGALVRSVIARLQGQRDVDRARYEAVIDRLNAAACAP